MSELKMFHLTLEDAIDYWVVAKHPDDVVALIEACEGDGFSSDAQPRIEEVTGDGLAKQFRDDDTGGLLTLAQALSTQDTEAVIACSEW